MHTDEYEISLAREIHVCRRKIEKIQKRLSFMEEKFNMTTEEFIARFDNGELIDDREDFTAWMNNYHALRIWQGSMKQYEELFSLMKI